MKHSWSALSCAAILALPLAWMGAGMASAQLAPAPTVEGIMPLTPSTQPASDAPDLNESVPLGHAYESQSAGISFRPPVDCMLIDQINARYLAEWSDAKRDWTLKLGKMVLDQPTPLLTAKNNFDKVAEGILDKTIKNLKGSLPGCEILRHDVTNTPDGGHYDSRHPELRNNVGLIAVRYTAAGQRRLSQQAIIRFNDETYYLLTLTTPGRRLDKESAVDDPAERQAADVFDRMTDSIRLLDRSGIRRDQETRLFNARAAFATWSPEKLHKALIGEQWVRILHDGRDIGYSYITEDQASGIPRPLTRAELNAGVKELDLARARPGDGILIGVRARMISDGVRSDKTRGPIQTDSASWFYVSADKKHEDFSRVVVTDDHMNPKKGYFQEFGISQKRVRRYFEPATPDAAGVVVQPDRAPLPVFKEDWELDVSETSSVGMAEPLTRKLPPWYIPQALTHLAPRLVPLQRPNSYLFATYVSDTREVMMRYIDVLPEQMVKFSNQAFRAIPIQDRLGLEGPVTVHYMSIDGIYLGSENKDQKLVMLPTDAGSLVQIWKDANLTRPGPVNAPGPANANIAAPKSQDGSGIR